MTLECGVCLHAYDAGPHAPTMLPTCGHTFCAACCTGGRSPLTVCPVCRSHNGARYVKNFALLDLVASGQPAQQPSSPAGELSAVLARCIATEVLRQVDSHMANQVPGEVAKQTEAAVAREVGSHFANQVPAEVSRQVEAVVARQLDAAVSRAKGQLMAELTAQVEAHVGAMRSQLLAGQRESTDRSEARGAALEVRVAALEGLTGAPVMPDTNKRRWGEGPGQIGASYQGSATQGQPQRQQQQQQQQQQPQRPATAPMQQSMQQSMQQQPMLPAMQQSMQPTLMAPPGMVPLMSQQQPAYPPQQHQQYQLPPQQQSLMAPVPYQQRPFMGRYS